LQVFQHPDIERLIRHDPLQRRILRLQLLQPRSLRLTQRPELRTPPKERLIGNPEPLTHLRDREALRLQLLRLPQLRHNLLRRVLLPLSHQLLPFGTRTSPNYDTRTGPNGRGPDTLIIETFIF